jgi:hypothetical protein
VSRVARARIFARLSVLLAPARAPARRLRRRASLLGVDATYAAAILSLAFFLFLRRWPLWEDQSIYHYMAWAARHGVVLYRDAINMNWPGTVIVHMLAQSIAGMDVWGVRLVEAVFLWSLCVSTAAILRAYRVALPFRIAATTAFLVAYFDGGNGQTAQRESFMTPCLAAALLPLLTAGLPGERRGRITWFLAGAAAAFGGSIKPTMALPLAGAALVASITWRGAARPLFAYVAGAATALGGVLAFLLSRADLHGFWVWGVGYTFGPYARLRWPGADQMQHWADLFTRPGLDPTTRLVLLGVAVAAVVVPLSALRIRRLGRGASAEAARDAARTIQLVLLPALVALSIYIQGKTHCTYHFIPMKWALSLLGAGLAGGPLLRRLRRAIRARPALRVAVARASLVAGISVFAAYARDDMTDDAEPSRLRFARQIAAALGPGETIVLFGFAPSVLYALERPTPLPFVDSWIMWAGAPEGSGFRAEMRRRWERALADPSVRFFVVEPGLRLPDGQRFVPGRDELSEGVVAQHFPPKRLEALGFRLTHAFAATAGTFVVYARPGAP